MTSLRLVTLLALGLLLAPASAHAQLLTGFGGSADLGAMELTGDDEDRIVDVSGLFKGGFPLFGTTYNSLYVTTNGFVSLGGPRSGPPPNNPFPLMGRPILAAWLADINASGTSSAAGGNRVHIHTESGRVVLTWYLVHPIRGATSADVSAQMVLSAAAGSSLLELRFGRCDWTQVGSAMVHAQVGVSRGDDAPGEFVALPGSGTADVADLCTGTNTVPPEPGVWRVVLPGTGIIATCGNFLRETGESCDDGNREDGDGCSATCTSAPVCGNNIEEEGEECDDGDRTPRDGCDENCQDEGIVDLCGNGDVDAADEECDDGNGASDDSCIFCLEAICGDGYLWADVETCDDSNTMDGDDCPANCGVTVMPMRDAGGGIPPGTGYTFEGGGCQCRAGMAQRDATFALALLSMLALALRRRARR